MVLLSVGILVGERVGLAVVGEAVGRSVGLTVGIRVNGEALGFHVLPPSRYVVGDVVGSFVRRSANVVGLEDGAFDGFREGIDVGASVIGGHLGLLRHPVR